MAHSRDILGRGPCFKVILAAFGGLFLVALLSVPVTTTESRLRQDPASRLVFRTTYPRNSTMFLPSYLTARARAGSGEVRVRSAQWVGTMVVIVVLGVFDSFALCSILGRSRKRREALDSDADGPGPGSPPRSSGLSLFP